MPLIVRKGNPAIGEQNGLPTWNGQPWPGGGEGGGDMYRLTYDANNNAKVDVAETAEHIDWDNITNKPSLHTHSNKAALDLISTDGDNALVWNGTVFNPTVDMSRYDSDDDGIVNSAETLQGLLSTISELNSLTGATSNIQSQIDALSNITNFRGSVDTHANLSTIATPADKDMVFVLTDETMSGVTSIYIYDGSDWVYVGTFDVELRNFLVDPINLANEVTGVLDESLVDPDLIRRTDFTSSLTNIDNAVSLRHTHTNKTQIDKIGQDGDGNPTWNGSEWPDSSSGVSSWNDLTDIPTELTSIGSDIDGNPTWNGSEWPGTATSLEWSSITNTPTALTKITEDVDGNPLWNGSEWPGSSGSGGVSSWNDLTDIPTSLNNITTHPTTGEPLWDGSTWPGTHAHIYWSDVLNKPLTDSDVTNLLDKVHSHVNKNLLDNYTLTDTQLNMAYNRMHVHTNSSVLDNLEEDLSGSLLYKGVGLDGDMKKSVYDTNNNNIVDKAETLDGLTASITELNYVTGVTSNIQSQINALSNAANFTGSVSTKADLSGILTPQANDMVIVIADEDNDGKSTIYLYNGSAWIFVGEFKSEMRDFTAYPINLATEVVGVLPETYISADIVREADFTNTLTDIDNAATLAHNHDNKDLLDNYTFTNTDISDTISKTHNHTNITSLNKITYNANNEPLWEGARWPGSDVSFYTSSALLPAVGENNRIYAIYEDDSMNTLSALYMWKNDAYVLVGGSSPIADTDPVSMFMNQETLLNVINGDDGNAISSGNPKTVALPIAPTEEFKLPKIEVLKFTEGSTDVSTTLFNFDSADATNFVANDAVVFDGTLRLKDSFEFTPTDEIIYEDAKVRTVTFDATQFVDVFSMSM
jgi:hypothetical protein